MEKIEKESGHETRICGASIGVAYVVLGVAVAYVSSKQDRTGSRYYEVKDALTHTEGEGIKDC